MRLIGLDQSHYANLSIRVRLDIPLSGPEVCVAGEFLNVLSDPPTVEILRAALKRLGGKHFK